MNPHQHFGVVLKKFTSLHKLVMWYNRGLEGNKFKMCDSF